MAVTTRPSTPPAAGDPAAVHRAAAADPPQRAGLALLAALLAALAYAAFASGATQLQDENRLQLGLAVVAALAAAAWLGAGSLRMRAPAVAWAGLALLAGFAAWSGISLLWSVAPDRTWVELNRGLAYALVAGLGILVGASHRRALEMLALGWLAVALAVALYALGGKLFPGLRIDGLIDLNHTASTSRLRAPLQYWNALALVCVMAIPIALRYAADPDHTTRWRLAGLAALHLLGVTLGLTYSRGGFVALGVALVVALWLGGGWSRALAMFAAAAAACAGPLAFAFTDDALSLDAIPLGDREESGLILAAIEAGSIVTLMLVGLWIIRMERRIRLTAIGRQYLRYAGVWAACALAFFALVGVAGDPRGLGDRFDSFTEAQTEDDKTDPNRLLSTNSGNRWIWWEEAAGAWWDKPAGGWGAGSFPVTHRRYREDEIDVLQPHSVPLQFLAETGVVGAGLGLGGLGLLLFAGIGAARSLPPGRPRAFAGAFAGAAAGWLVHGFVDWDWDIPGASLPAFLFLGVLAGVYGRGGEPPPERSARDGARPLALAGATALLCLFAISSFLPAAADREAGDVLADLPARPSEQDLADAARAADRASKLNPLAVQPLFAAASIAERRERPDQARALLLEAVERQPDSASAWFRLARTEFVRGDLEGVETAARRALALDPNNRTLLGFAARIEATLAPPAQSATAIGTPLPTLVTE